MLRDARRQLDALAGQLASAWEMAAHTTTAGSTQFERLEAARPRTLRIRATLEILRANLNLRSAVFRHALRLSACVGVGEVLAQSVGWRRSYWMPMTSAIVLRPDFTTTFSRGVLRVAGTLIGLGLATGLFHALAPAGEFEVALIALFTFLLRSFGPANYGIFAAALTALVVLLFTVTGVAPGPVIAARGLNTLAGGMLALAAYQVWPTWERSLTPEALARLLDAYRVYFRTLCDAYILTGQSFAAELDRARQAARLARSNAEASVARLATEPGVTAQRIAKVNAMLANSHRFIHAAMSIGGGAGAQPLGSGARGVPRVRQSRGLDAVLPGGGVARLQSCGGRLAGFAGRPLCAGACGRSASGAVCAGQRGGGPDCEQSEYAGGGSVGAGRLTGAIA